MHKTFPSGVGCAYGVSRNVLIRSVVLSHKFKVHHAVRPAFAEVLPCRKAAVIVETCVAEAVEEVLGGACIDGFDGLRAEDAVSSDSHHTLHTFCSTAAGEHKVHYHVRHTLAVDAVGKGTPPVSVAHDGNPLGICHGAEVGQVTVAVTVVVVSAGYPCGKCDAAVGPPSRIVGVSGGLSYRIEQLFVVSVKYVYSLIYTL